MSRGEYEINKSPKPLKDESFKSMVCALLVFLSICIIILLAALPWKTYSSKPAVAEKEKDVEEIDETKNFDNMPVSGKLKDATDSKTFHPVVKTTEIADEFPITEGHETTKKGETTTDNIGNYKPITKTSVHVYNTTYIRINLNPIHKNISKVVTEISNTEIASTENAKEITEQLLTTSKLNEQTTLHHNLTETTTPGLKIHTTILSQDNTNSPIIIGQDTTIISDLFDSIPKKINKEIKGNSEPSTDIITTESLLENETTLSILTTTQVTEDGIISNTEATTTNVEEKILELSSQSNEMQTETSSAEIGTIFSTVTENIAEASTEINTISSIVSLINITTDDSTKQTEATQNGEETTTITLEENNVNFNQRFNDSLTETTLPSIKEENNEVSTEINTESSIITFINIPEDHSTKQEETIKNGVETTTVTLEENLHDDLITTTTRNIEIHEKENMATSTSATTIIRTIEKETIHNLENTTMSASVTNHPIILQKMLENKTTTTEQAETPVVMIETDYTEVNLVTKPPKKFVKDEICNTAVAKKVASEMLYLMDHSVDACDDFYQFSCGGSQKEEKTNEFKMLDAISQALEIKTGNSSANDVRFFQDFYDQCCNYHTNAFDYRQRVLNVTNIIHSIGNPLDDVNMTSDLLSNLTSKLLEYDYAPLFDISLDIEKTTKQDILKITLGEYMDESFKLNHRKMCIQYMKKKQSEITDLNEMYKIFLQCTRNYSDYVKEVEVVLRELSIFPEKEINSTIKIINIILRHYNNLPAPGYLRNVIVNKKYHTKNVRELNKIFPIFKWQEFLSTLSGKQVKEQDDVQVYFESFFKNLFCLKDIKIQDFYNAQLAMFSHNLYRKLVIHTPNNVNRYCLSQAAKLLNTTATKLFVSSFSDTDLRNNISAINSVFSQLKSEFIKEDFAWVETEAGEIDDKVNLMQLEVNVDSWKHSVEKDLEEVVDNYQELYLALIKRNRRASWKSLQIPRDKSLFSIFALNKIVATPLILTEVIPKDIPLYISNARLGYILAKEIGRHFDTIGITYGVNLEGNSLNAYNNLEACSSQKYAAAAMLRFQGRSYIYQINQTLSLTLNDRIAEDLAIKLLSNMTNELVADKKILWLSELFSKKQIFYIAAAQVYCRKLSMEDFLTELFESEVLPPSVLLQMSLSNLISFRETFKCPVGSSMAHPLECKAFQDLEKADEDLYDSNELL